MWLHASVQHLIKRDIFFLHLRQVGSEVIVQMQDIDFTYRSTVSPCSSSLASRSFRRLVPVKYDIDRVQPSSRSQRRNYNFMAPHVHSLAIYPWLRVFPLEIHPRRSLAGTLAMEFLLSQASPVNLPK
jgi:hypothetical protein